MAIEQLTEEVATNLEEVAEVTRKLNTVGLSYLAFGLGIGAAVGFYFGYRYNREKIRAEAYEEADEEVDQLREMYIQKTRALPNLEKPSVEEIIQERGYSQAVPKRESPPRPLPAPVPIRDDIQETPSGPILEIDEQTEMEVPTSKSVNEGWNYEIEQKNRTPDFPYVIHQNEYNHSQPEYSKVVFTYFSIDDVVVDTEDERPVPHGDIVVGLDNLKFGHGSDDMDVVYVRNDRLESDMQICRVNRSFEEEVLGLSRDDDAN